MNNEMSPLREAAVQMHEMYVELKAAGFNRSEALELIVKTIGQATAEAAQQKNEDDD
jgi:hypothetical protein